MRYYRVAFGTDNRSRIIRDDADGPAQVERRERKMDKIERCVSDVVAIANGARDHEQAKARMKELLDDAKFQLGQWFSTAQRLRDQLRVVYSDVETVSAKQFLDELIEWLQAKHLRD